MSSDQRIDPDLLLKDLNQIEENKKIKGKLRIFLGMCPGVGKTYSMLKAAQERKLEGIDIVIGLIETHGRIETENMVKNLEIIPRKKLVYKNTDLNEMDLDAIIERKPQIVLVDELAHTNIPGSRHPKRYMDVIELLNLGIDVYSTVNIQHIDTRSDIVTKITGINIKETIPDSILSNANQVELIDLNPEDLIKRLKEGKVYLGDRAAKALDNFFKLEHLIALRELALRFTAEIVDGHLRNEMTQKGIQGPWNTNERLLVAISHSPYSPKLIRAARRMAYNLEAPWIALYIDTGEALEKSDIEQLNQNITLAKELGAEFITVSDQDIVESIKRIAKQRNVSQIIIGRPDRRFSDILNRGTILERLSREASEIDIHVLRQERTTRFKLHIKELFAVHSSIAAYYNALWSIFFFTIIVYFVKDFIGYRPVGFLYLLLVLFVSSVAGRGPIIFTAILSSLIWDYLFIPPFFTFQITHKEDIMLCATYLVVALFTGYLANERRKQQHNLIEREEKTNLLYEVTKQLSNAETLESIALVARKHFEKVIPSSTEVYLTETDNPHSLSRKSTSFPPNKLEDKEFAVATWVFLNQKKAGWSTDTLSSAKCLCLPLKASMNIFGVVVIYPHKNFTLNIGQEHFLETILNLVSGSIERILLSLKAQQTQVLMASEKLHHALFNSVSHELKTPLTALIGASTTLKTYISEDENIQRNLLNDIIDSSYRLNRVVENLLDMSRISTGHLNLKLEFFELNDFFYNIINRNPKLSDVTTIEAPENEDFIILGDSKLLEHAFLNLLLNAKQYSPENSPIKIVLIKDSATTKIKIVDQGIGISPDEKEKVFERFYRAKNSKPGGTGLGLSIVKEVIETHGGQIETYSNNNGIGSTFEVKLPTRIEA